jgi:glycosyltransferase 2 family protein
MKQRPEKKYPVLKAVIKLIITLAALYFVYTRIDLKAIGAILQSMSFWPIPLAVIAFILSKVISAYRLNYFLSASGIYIEQGYNLRLYLLGMFYNLSLPGGIGGDGYKIWLLNKRTGAGILNTFRAILMDRINGILFLVILALLFAIFKPTGQIPGYLPLIAIPAVLVLYLVVSLIFFPVFNYVLLKGSGLSLIVQVLQVICVWFILISLQIEEGQMAYLLIFLISSVIAAIPITIGGAGAREIAFVFGAQYFSLDINTSVAISLLFYLITVLVSLTGSFYMVRPGDLKPE